MAGLACLRRSEAPRHEGFICTAASRRQVPATHFSFVIAGLVPPARAEALGSTRDTLLRRAKARQSNRESQPKLNSRSPCTALLDARNKSGHDDNEGHVKISRRLSPRVGGMARRSAQNPFGSVTIAGHGGRLAARHTRSSSAAIARHKRSRCFPAAAPLSP
jgi:hypothetical protein